MDSPLKAGTQNMHFNILTFDILDSTNSEALRQVRQGADEGLCIIARQQTGGRGRYGRTWVSERDAGVYFSIVLKPHLEATYLPLITLMAGIAVHDTLREIGIEPDIKWVNDVLVNEKKISGILAETTETPEGLAVIVGIGINLTSTNFPPDRVTTATCVEDCVPVPVAGDKLIEILMRNLSRFYSVLAGQNGPAEIVEHWRQRSSYFAEKIVRVVLENETITGTTDGLENNGALRIKRGDGTVVVIQAGDVEQVRAVG
jgi:BirA family transcriptional regulator, biotin operon repressor / biotin---[acetyl-CoA-carboxylase] ligase